MTLHLPFEVADYVDFYSSRAPRRERRPDLPARRRRAHAELEAPARSATTAGPARSSCRAPTSSARAASARPPDDAAPTYGPSVRLDIEAEVGFVVGVPSRARHAGADVGAFREHVFGVVPASTTGAPATSRPGSTCRSGRSSASRSPPRCRRGSCRSTRSEAARVAGPVQDPAVLPYLRDDADWGLDLTLEVRLNGTVVSRPPFAQMYWTPAQQLAHLTVNGASLRTGDLFASGTVSGAEPRPARLVPRAVLERHRAGHPRRRLDPHLPRGRRRGVDHRVGAGRRRAPGSASARSAAGSSRPAAEAGCAAAPTRLRWRDGARAVRLLRRVAEPEHVDDGAAAAAHDDPDRPRRRGPRRSASGALPAARPERRRHAPGCAVRRSSATSRRSGWPS